ncbi:MULTISPECIES: Wzz/FepE/Etk N-terminal domain-containing protein [unclassified Mannheimia]|uniref:Wzz/FepE/Etk N-terminal domain-containing protein n=1 Tax=unclassified Mannheimia TaxID=2645054 RepID=UPI00359F087A
MADLPKTVEQHSDEIDLTEIIRVLWDKKIWIILTTFVTTLLAGIYAFTAKEQWTSKATVIAPTLTDLGDYLDIRREYSRILRTEAVDPAKLAAGLFGNFKLLAKSSDAKNEFFQQSELYSKLIKDKTEEAQRAILFNK